MTEPAETAEQLARKASIAVWAGCRREELPHIKVDMLASASRTAEHYALGGAMHDLSRQTVIIRSGFALGILRSK